jgi:carboxypeptidase C (cathepsin A)
MSIFRTSENIIRSFDELPWHGHAAFRREPYGPFYYGRQGGDRILAGQYKSVGNLTVVTVNEAGHMSVHDQPEATLDLLAAWVSNSSIV